MPEALDGSCEDLREPRLLPNILVVLIVAIGVVLRELSPMEIACKYLLETAAVKCVVVASIFALQIRASVTKRKRKEDG